MAEIFEENTEANEWTKFGMKIAISTTLHPLEYGKVLIQVDTTQNYQFYFVFIIKAMIESNVN